LASLAQRGRELAERSPAWLGAWRERGRLRFEQLGLPTTRDEEWRVTNLAPIVQAQLRPVARDPAPPVELSGIAALELGGPRLVFVDGTLAPALSSDRSPEGLWVGNLDQALAAVPDKLREALGHRDPAAAEALDSLNAACCEDMALVLAEPGFASAAPVQLVFLARGGAERTAIHPRTLVVVGRGSRLTVVETYASLDGGVYLTNAVSDIRAADGAHVEHHRLQLESDSAFHVSRLHSHQGRDSRAVLLNVDLGGRLVRHDVVAGLHGEGADCLLRGLYLARGEQHVDNHTHLDHAEPHGSSRELYKGILSDRSRTVFNGRILVRPAAQKTDAKQSNPNLILSRGALAHTRPQLEIYANDVKCTHGATVGRLDEEAVFYLRSRGLGEQAARRLLVTAFADEVLAPLEPPPLREALQRAVLARLPHEASS
jgi:Fe-S cluster assembly protein SufD